MIEIVTLEDSPVSDSFLGEVGQAIQALPECISDLLVQHCYKVVISHLLTDYRPDLKGVPLPQNLGWNLEKRNVKYYDNIKALCSLDKKVITYPEYFLDLKNGEPVKNQKFLPQEVLYHEIGHVIDELPKQNQFRRFSNTLFFIDAYCRDLARISWSKKNKLDYALNHSALTRREIFADTFSAVLEAKSKRTKLQLTQFPSVATYIREQILVYLNEIYEDEESLHALYATLSNMPLRKSFQELVSKANSL